MTSKIYLLFILADFLGGCISYTVERQASLPGEFTKLHSADIRNLKVQSPYLKAHMKNGSLYVFSSWDYMREGSEISGEAQLFDPSRSSVPSKLYKLGLDSVALLETNVISNSGAAVAMTVFTGITAAVTFFCITNPKACYGSCPTFYVSDGDSMRLQAEGFSSSITPSLEATDVDALYDARANNGTLNLVMRNEALETHVVRSVNLLAVPRRQGCRVFNEGDQRYWESSAVLPPISAQGPEGDCLPLVRKKDGVERFSLADETYLATKETLDLEFHIRPNRSYGLVVACRQTLLPTYLLYQTFAYMGNDAGHWLAQLERKAVPLQYNSMAQLIGGIEALTRGEDGQWKLQGAIDEHGPLATDVHLISIGTLRDSTLSVRLRMTKGTWRIDYVALAELSRELQPIRLQPKLVLRDNKEDPQALAHLLDPSNVLITLPGDSYTLTYDLPDSHNDYELFLESRGYYLEWIRKEWIDEENPMYLTEMFFSPESALQRMTKEFKSVEARMEDCFWRSRYAKP